MLTDDGGKLLFFLCFSVLEYVIRIKDVRDFCFIVFHHVIEIHSWLPINFVNQKAYLLSRTAR